MIDAARLATMPPEVHDLLEALDAASPAARQAVVEAIRRALRASRSIPPRGTQERVELSQRRHE